MFNIPCNFEVIINCFCVNIHIFPVPPILEAVGETVLLYRSNVSHSIRCSILGSTEAPAWYYNNIPISTGSGRNLLTNKILFDPFTANHSGWYTCATSNKYGRTERDYLVLATSELNQICMTMCHAQQFTV